MNTVQGIRISMAWAVAAWLAACGSDPEAPQREQARLGVMLPQTGSAADLGVTAERVVQLALAEINDHGGVMGRPLRIVVRDPQEDPERVAGIALDLLDETESDIFVAGMASSLADRILQETVPRQAVMVNPLSGLLTLSEGRAGYFFRTLPVFGRPEWFGGWQELLLNEGHRSQFFLANAAPNFVQDTDDAESAFVEQCPAPGCTTVKRTYPETHTDQDIASLLAGVDPTTPDVVTVMGFEDDVIDVLRAIEVRGYGGALILNDLFGAVGPNFARLLLPDTVRRIRWVDSIAGTGLDADTFRTRFRALHGISSVLGRPELTTYDAVIVSALAIERAQTTRQPGVGDALTEVVNAPGTRVGPFEYARAVELLAAGEDIDYEGFQLTDFNSDGENLAVSDPAFFGWNENGEVIPWVAN